MGAFRPVPPGLNAHTLRTPDLSGRACCNEARCRINPAFRWCWKNEPRDGNIVSPGPAALEGIVTAEGLRRHNSCLASASLGLYLQHLAQGFEI